VLLNIVERCGPREKWALFMTCHSCRRLVLEADQQLTEDRSAGNEEETSSAAAGPGWMLA
jgi:hypothetical protein